MSLLRFAMGVALGGGPHPETPAPPRAADRQPYCTACPVRRGVQRHRAIRDGLCTLHLTRRDRAAT